MSLWRWAITIVGYPLGGLLAITVTSTTAGPASAALAGAIAGAVLGLAQWLALRPRISAWWILATALGLAGGAALGALVTGGVTDAPSLVTFGAMTGLVVGLAQAPLLGRRGFVWAPVVAAAHALAWLITAAVIVDEQRGFVLFGLSGAAAATLITGGALRVILGARESRVARAADAEVTA